MLCAALYKYGPRFFRSAKRVTPPLWREARRLLLVVFAVQARDASFFLAAMLKLRVRVGILAP